MCVEDCGYIVFVYWVVGKLFFIIVFECGNGGLWKLYMIGIVLFNGVKMWVVFDFGVQIMIMILVVVKCVGIILISFGVMLNGFYGGFGLKQVKVWFVFFVLIDLGGEIVFYFKFCIVDIQFDGDMLIGFDFFLIYCIFVLNVNY